MRLCYSSLLMRLSRNSDLQAGLPVAHVKASVRRHHPRPSPDRGENWRRRSTETQRSEAALGVAKDAISGVITATLASPFVLVGKGTLIIDGGQGSIYFNNVY